MRADRASLAPVRGMRRIMAIFLASAFLLLALKTLQPISFVLALAVPLIFIAAVVIIPKLFRADRLLLNLVMFLSALGVLVLCRMDIHKGLTQAINLGIGVLAMLFFIALMGRVRSWRVLAPMGGIAALLFMMLPLLIGRTIYGAKAWLFIAGISIQPSELGKIALLVLVAHLLSERKVFLAIVFTGLALLILMKQADLGTALVYYATVLIMLFAATGNFVLVGGGLAGAMAGGWLGYRMYAHVRDRLRIWIDPWAHYQNKGYQIVQALIAMVNGGPWGVGLGVGNAYSVPAYTTDFIYSVVLNEFGWLFGVLVILLYVVILLRGISIASRARSKFHMLLALGASSMIIIQTVIIIGGNITMFPLTGITLPFVSYGGSSLLSSLSIMGLLLGVANATQAGLQEDQALAGVEVLRT